MVLDSNIKMKFYCTKENLKIINIMDLENIFMVMVISMKVILKMIHLMAKANVYLKMEVHTYDLI